jgi:hypothetical protein
MNLLVLVGAGAALSALVLLSAVFGLISKRGMRRIMLVTGLASALILWGNLHVLDAKAIFFVDPSNSARDVAFVNSGATVPLRRIGWFGYAELRGEAALRYTDAAGRRVERGYYDSPCLIWMGVADEC